jgi:hypothetical protein
VRRGYRANFERAPALLAPRRFTEKMQWRKLFQLEPRFALFCDKLATRGWVAERVGEVALPELLWAGSDPDAIPFDALVGPWVLKPTHSCGRVAFLHEGQVADASLLRAQAREWLTHSQGDEFIEPGYRAVRPGLMVERLLRAPGGGPADEHRVLCFDGRAALVQSTRPRRDEGGWLIAFHDRDWNYRDIRFRSPVAPMPLPDADTRARIVALAEALVAGHDHLRVDIYDAAQGLVVGEITSYSWSGAYPFHPDAVDLELGALWRIPHPARDALRAVARGRWAIRP